MPTAAPLKIPANRVDTLPTDTVVAVMPVWSLNADFGMVDLVDEPVSVPTLLVDEQAASAAASTTAVRTAAALVSRRRLGLPIGAGPCREVASIGDLSPCVVGRPPDLRSAPGRPDRYDCRESGRLALGQLPPSALMDRRPSVLSPRPVGAWRRSASAPC